MRLRVKETADRGHMVHGRMYAPGEQLPGEWPGVPALMDWKLEKMPERMIEIDASTIEQEPGTRMIPVPEPAAAAPPPEPEEEPENEEPTRPRRGRPPGSGRFARPS